MVPPLGAPLKPLTRNFTCEQGTPWRFFISSFMKKVPGSPIAIVIRLLVSEGRKHPDLCDYYYDNVVARGMGAIREFVRRGVERGEFRREALELQPHLFFAPMMLSMIWRLVFTEKPLDTDKLMESQVDMLLNALKA